MIRVFTLCVFLLAVAVSVGACTTSGQDAQDAGAGDATSSESANAATADGYPAPDSDNGEAPAEGYPGAEDDAAADDDAGAKADPHFAVAPEDIVLDAHGLAADWQAVVVAGTEYDESLPPGPQGLPTHIQILFGAADPADREPLGPIMYIVPVDTYRELWDAAGNNSVSATIASIEQFAAPLDTSPTQGVPALPYEEVVGYNDVAVQIGRAVAAGEVNEVSATQDGYRFVGRWAMDANPVTNEGLRYVYQGFTNDGVYLVAFYWPVTSSELPDDAGSLTQEQWDEFYADPTAAVVSQGEAANELAAEQWEPDLTTLDAVVASLQIDGMTSAGLLDTTWEWVAGPVQPGSSETVTVTNPAAYLATYGSDGTLTFTADCNSGSAGFELTDTGSSGGMLTDSTAAVTLVECGSGSHSQGFVNGLQAAQSFMLHAGGHTMDLVLPAGGGTLLMRSTE